MKKVKIILLISVLVFSLKLKAQDTTYIPVGYTLDYPYLYVLVDTVHKITQVHNYYPHKMYFTVNNNDSLYVPHHGVFTV